LPGALPSISPGGPAALPAALKASTRSRTVCNPTPPTCAAALRQAPSPIAASANNRRVCAASRDGLARARSCRREFSRSPIATPMANPRSFAMTNHIPPVLRSRCDHLP
jgi:hypothetical protein